jgi:hypothetical protein
MRLDNAQKSLEVAELAAAEQEIPASRSVAAALAVLSGIASADAACCAALGAARAGRTTVKPRHCCVRSFRTVTERRPPSSSS